MGRLIPAGTGMEYYRNVNIERDETIGESQREEIDELPEILGSGLAMPEPHVAVPATVLESDAEEEEEELEVAEVEDE
jgi:hypothetical protein